MQRGSLRVQRQRVGVQGAGVAGPAEDVVRLDELAEIEVMGHKPAGVEQVAADGGTVYVVNNPGDSITILNCTGGACSVGGSYRHQI